MKDIFKSFLFITGLIAAFFFGIHFGKTKEKAKIPNFQQDLEGRV